MKCTTFDQGSIGFRSTVVHYIGNRGPFGTNPQFDLNMERKDGIPNPFDSRLPSGPPRDGEIIRNINCSSPQGNSLFQDQGEGE